MYFDRLINQKADAPKCKQMYGAGGLGELPSVQYCEPLPPHTVGSSNGS